MTPTQREAYLKQKRFHANIAFRAALLSRDAHCADDAKPVRAASGLRPRGNGGHTVVRARRSAVPTRDTSVDDLGWLIEICGFDPAPRPRQGGTAIALIQDVVARRFNISVQDIVSARKPRDVVLPRQIAMYLAKVLTPRTLPDIGSKFGDRDHSTVIHAIKKIERLMAGDPSFAQLLASLRQELQ